MNESSSVWSKNFIIFVTAQSFSFIGKALMRFVLPLYILLETGDSALMGGILAVSMIPAILISPISGVIVDRIKKNKLLAIVNVTTSVGIVLFWLTKDVVGIIPATIFMMLILLTADSLTALTGKSSVSIVSPPGTLVRANSILFLAISFSIIVTPILGGFALGRIGINSVLLISLAFLIVAAFINLMTNIPCKLRASDSKVMATAISDMKAGFRFTFTEKPKIGRVILFINMMYCITLFSLTTITLPILVTGYFSGSEELLGMTQAMVGLGGIVGTLFINHLGEKASIRLMRPIIISSGLTLVPLTVALLWGNNHVLTFFLMCVTIFAIFAFNGMLIILGRAYFGNKTPADMIGKVMGINSTFVLLGVALGGYLYGVLFDWFADTPGMVFLILAVASAVVGFFAKVEKQEGKEAV